MSDLTLKLGLGCVRWGWSLTVLALFWFGSMRTAIRSLESTAPCPDAPRLPGVSVGVAAQVSPGSPVRLGRKCVNEALKLG